MTTMNVPIDRLFRVTKEEDVAGQRITAVALGEAQLYERRTACMVAKAKTLKALRDKDSDQYITHLSDIEEADDEGLKTIILLHHQLKVREDLEREIVPNYIPFPEPASPEEEVETVEAREAEMKRVWDERTAKGNERFDKEKARLDGLNREQLVKEATRAQTDLVVREVWSRTYNTYTILLGTRRNGSPLFNNEAEAESVHPSVRSKLLSMVLEVTAIDPLYSNGQSSTD